MSEDKAIKILESLGGSADIKAIREKARKMYPDTQLWRTIHTVLKRLVDKKQVTYRGKLRKGNSVWTLTNLKIPPIKTADKLLTEERPESKFMRAITEQHPAAMTMNYVDQTAKLEKPSSEGDSLYQETMIKIKDAVVKEEPKSNIKILMAEQMASSTAKPIEEPKTIAHEIRQAMKEPYLDKLEELAENVEKKEYKYRGRHDIIYDILRDLKSQTYGRTITDIMYKSMLSYYQLKKYMATLFKNELIEKDLYREGIYKITQKGTHYLETMDSIPINFD